MQLSVIIPTYNPDAARLQQTLLALKNQSLPADEWELVIIDNNSTNNFEQQINLSWHPAAKIIRETKQGLTYARLKGFNESTGDIIVMADDDNILDSAYFEKASNIFGQNPKMGAIGGKSVPLFETTPPKWLGEFYGSLALRDLGDEPITATWNNEYPNAAPIGAGMAIRREAITSYIKKITFGKNSISDRTGNSLSSGGDNDMVLEILKSSWQVGYFPELMLQHIIPAQRMEADYLARLLSSTNKSWIQLLQNHDINPWQQVTKTGALLRKTKAWFSYKAWKSKPDYIKWQGACGTFDGLASLPHK
ncbi:Glycosyl transferase family 2 [Mucilaginibacter gossypiicola]|uniref:Glycosyl transferase family 2 n=1 Tax=Mucilaginibacter gossypiicola TaxID=551995 RepID=A0A1H8N1Z9_9SPHI|nr:glycosyltransferase [Mucilaginibacter gossypiicola]SEO23546.1 Glycosyl transferase family 2 [Mucilaginibacter gossypiicola]